jgi:hypothetical protein
MLGWPDVSEYGTVSAKILDYAYFPDQFRHLGLDSGSAIAYDSDALELSNRLNANFSHQPWWGARRDTATRYL